jgi:hypothetical protein
MSLKDTAVNGLDTVVSPLLSVLQCHKHGDTAVQLGGDYFWNSKTNVEKAFFFIFMSSCPEMSF